MTLLNACRRPRLASAFLALSIAGSSSCSSKPDDRAAAAPPRTIIKDLPVYVPAPAVCSVPCEREPAKPSGVHEDATLGLPMALAVDVTIAGRDCRAKHDACAEEILRRERAGATP